MSAAVPSFAFEAIPDDIVALIKKGEFKQAQAKLGDLAKSEDLSPDAKAAVEYEIERLNRIPLDFCLDHETITAQLKKKIPDVTDEEIVAWREAGELESRVIEGETMYFERGVVNLLRLNKEAKARAEAHDKKNDPNASKEEAKLTLEDCAAQVLEARRNADSKYVLPQRYRVDYTLTVDADAVPDGETVRAWLVYPREWEALTDVVYLSSEPAEHFIAPNETLQRSIYLEKPAKAGEPTVFKASYEFTNYSQAEFVDPTKIEPYDKDSEVYQEFTAERDPHLVFTPELKKLAAEIVGDETNPYLKAKMIFGWICENVTYTSAFEYSTYKNLSGDCAARLRGDCGIQSLLFIVLCRINGVPARWQSGWKLSPWYDGMHDWALVFVEPYGWLPVDQSFALLNSDREEIKWFNFGNMDNFRLSANDDYAREFNPPKKHFRSETNDFQRGEVEWDGGNLYFDQWSYNIESTRIPLENE